MISRVCPGGGEAGTIREPGNGFQFWTSQAYEEWAGRVAITFQVFESHHGKRQVPRFRVIQWIAQQAFPVFEFKIRAPLASICQVKDFLSMLGDQVVREDPWKLSEAQAGIPGGLSCDQGQFDSVSSVQEIRHLAKVFSVGRQPIKVGIDNQVQPCGFTQVSESWSLLP
ncbi:MAG: hypothetical protein HGA84_03200 [Syntrophobacteraceae bacterium]|nr:hypothetical protein [Syntrophobacteraceae bacterium]